MILSYHILNYVELGVLGRMDIALHVKENIVKSFELCLELSDVILGHNVNIKSC